MISIQSRGRLLSLAEPVVMGVLNITPDSFYSGSRIADPDTLLRHAERMLKEGASVLDIGGMSTRPGADMLGEKEEMERLVPAIRLLASTFPEAILSVDSFRPAVAEAALEAGAGIINDIGAAPDSEMPRLAASWKVPYVCMHMRGTPETMQQLTNYENLLTEVIDSLAARAAACRQAGVKDIILDPGFGFAKTISQNFILLHSLKAIRAMGYPVLAGLSRKSTVYRTLGVTAEEALNGTTVLNTLALEQGADMLRVHDVKLAVEAIKLWLAYKKAGSSI